MCGLAVRFFAMAREITTGVVSYSFTPLLRSGITITPTILPTGVVIQP